MIFIEVSLISDLICPRWRPVENPPEQQLNCQYNQTNYRACVTNGASRVVADARGTIGSNHANGTEHHRTGTKYDAEVGH